jgi:predicted  nucleic acid-binding Zn-ribbon protein
MFPFGLRENSLAAEGREMMPTARMERPIDEIRKAERAMQELLAAAGELRRQIDLACAENPEETAELRKAAAALEKEVQRIKDSLQRWRQSIQ